jgi:hypothetical protein
MIAIDWLATHWLQISAAVLLVAFIVFAFGQGMKVKPLPSNERPPDNIA